VPAPVPPRPAAWGAWRRLGWLARFTAGELRRNPGTTLAAGGMVALFVLLLG
jgi:hypothetical protein